MNTFELKDRVLASRPGRADRVSVILNGVNLERFHPPAERPAGPPVILCVARLVPDKDHATLIKAFARLGDSHPQAELWLVGAGELEGRLKALSQELAPGRVKFQPTTTDPAPLYQRASVFVLASQKEALPNVVLEAMASGLPVAASNAGGLPEVVKHGQTGLISPVGDDTALAASLARLLDDPELAARLGRNGRESAADRFSLDEYGAREPGCFSGSAGGTGAGLTARRRSGPSDQLLGPGHVPVQGFDLLGRSGPHIHLKRLAPNGQGLLGRAGLGPCLG